MKRNKSNSSKNAEKLRREDGKERKNKAHKKDNLNSKRAYKQAKDDFSDEASAREDILIGRNSIMEALVSDREIEKIIVSDNSEGSIKKIVAIARDKGIIVDRAEKAALGRIAGTDNHQGVLAFVTEFKYSSVEEILEVAKEKGEEPFVIILDSVTDPHNLGAIMRTAECTGVHGIIIPKRRAVGVNQTVDKAAAGASQYVKVAKVTNLVSTIEKLKEENIWIYSCDMDGDDIFGVDFKGGVAIVLGNEGKGISKSVRESSDFVISIPMRGRINSLNVSNAGAVTMYQVAKNKFFNKK